jgi:hypothetical protein
MPIYPTNIKYKDQSHFMCSSMFYNRNICGTDEPYLQPPKKALIYSKPENKMSKTEFYKWTTKFKIR